MQKHRVQIEQIDQQFSNLMEANGIDISSLGTTTEDVKNSINEEEFTNTMVNVSDIELDMSYIPGVSIDDMSDRNSRTNYVTIGDKIIKINVEPNEIPSILDYQDSVDESFEILFEVKDRIDDEDTTTAKRKEKYNQKNRRSKEKSSNITKPSSSPEPNKSKEATDVDSRFETEVDDPLLSRSGEWIGLEPDAKIDRLKEIKDALYELIADPEMNGVLDPNNKYVKDWYIKSRPFYDAYHDEENTVSLYGAASDIKDIINNWEKLDQQYKKIAGKIKKSPVKSTTEHERDFDPPAPAKPEASPEAAPVEESVELDEAWTADTVIHSATAGAKGYGINIKKTGGVTKTPHKHMLLQKSTGKKIKVIFDHGKDKFVGTPEEVASHLNKILGIKESVEELDKAFSDIFEKWKDNRDYTEDYGAGFEGTPEYIKKLIKDTPHAKIPQYVGSMNKKGESNGTRLSKGR